MIMNMILSQEAITEVNENYTDATGQNPARWKLKNEAESMFVPILLAQIL